MAVSANVQNALNSRVAIHILHPIDENEMIDVRDKLKSEGFDVKVNSFNNGTKAKPIKAYVVRAFEKKK